MKATTRFGDKDPEVAKFFIMLGRGILNKTKAGKSFLHSILLKHTHMDGSLMRLLALPSEEETIAIMSKPSKERNKEELIKVSKYFSQKHFFQKLIEKGNGEVVDQLSKEMNLEVFEKDTNIINWGEIGHTFYVIVKGDVDVYIPMVKKEKMTYKEFIEFCLPQK